MAAKPKFEIMYINGVFQGILDEIVASSEKSSSQIVYIQSRSKRAIAGLREYNPSPERPINCYVSSLENFNEVEYQCEIVGWSDKRELSEAEKAAVKESLAEFQPAEGRSSFEPDDGSVNLISVRNLKKLDQPFSITKLVKSQGDLPRNHKEKGRPGGFAYIDSVDP